MRDLSYGDSSVVVLISENPGTDLARKGLHYTINSGKLCCVHVCNPSNAIPLSG